MRFGKTLALIGGAFVLATASPSAQAEDLKIGVVDFQRALEEVREGELARAKLEGMMEAKRGSLQRMEQELQARQAEFEKQAAILSAEAQQQRQSALMQEQYAFQQTYMQAEQEMQQMYASMMEELITKMKGVAGELGKEKGYDLLLEMGGGAGLNVVYHEASMDLTNELIKRYDLRHGG